MAYRTETSGSPRGVRRHASGVVRVMAVAGAEAQTTTRPPGISIIRVSAGARAGGGAGRPFGLLASRASADEPDAGFAADDEALAQAK